MLNSIVRAPILLLALLVAIGITAQSAAADEQIALVERATNNSVVDSNDKGDSVGDLLIFANKLFDAGNKTQVGNDSGWCIRTIVSQAWECSWTAVFEDGQIMVQGPFYDHADSVLAITGGTGAYAGARGELRLHSRKPDGTEYDFVYVLLN